MHTDETQPLLNSLKQAQEQADVNNYKLLNSQLSYSNSRYSIYAEDHQIGKKGVFPFTTVKTYDWVLIVPETENRELLMISQYRAAWRMFSIEFPAGKMDHENEDPLEAAKRELVEETGFGARNWELLGVCKPVTWTTQTAYFYKASDLYLDNSLSPDDSEDISVEAFSLGKVKDLIKSNKIVEVPSITAFHYYQIL